jgi:hypothetical protein
MVLPLMAAALPLALAGGTFGLYYSLTKYYDKRRCEEEFDGSCDRECDYFEGNELTCHQCLGSCGVQPEDYTYYLNKLYNAPPQVVEREVIKVVERDRDRDRNRGDRDRDRDRQGPRRPDRFQGDRDHDRHGRPRGRGGGGNREEEKENEMEEVQDKLDELSGENNRQHVGGGHADMTRDNRGLRAIRIA